MAFIRSLTPIHERLTQYQCKKKDTTNTSAAITSYKVIEGHDNVRVLKVNFANKTDAEKFTLFIFNEFDISSVTNRGKPKAAQTDARDKGTCVYLQANPDMQKLMNGLGLQASDIPQFGLNDEFLVKSIQKKHTALNPGATETQTIQEIVEHIQNKTLPNFIESVKTKYSTSLNSHLLTISQIEIALGEIKSLDNGSIIIILSYIEYVRSFNTNATKADADRLYGLAAKLYLTCNDDSDHSMSTTKQKIVDTIPMTYLETQISPKSSSISLHDVFAICLIKRMHMYAVGKDKADAGLVNDIFVMFDNIYKHHERIKILQSIASLDFDYQNFLDDAQQRCHLVPTLDARIMMICCMILHGQTDEAWTLITNLDQVGKTKLNRLEQIVLRNLLLLRLVSLPPSDTIEKLIDFIHFGIQANDAVQDQNPIVIDNSKGKVITLIGCDMPDANLQRELFLFYLRRCKHAYRDTEKADIISSALKKGYQAILPEVMNKLDLPTAASLLHHAATLNSISMLETVISTMPAQEVEAACIATTPSTNDTPAIESPLTIAFKNRHFEFADKLVRFLCTQRSSQPDKQNESAVVAALDKGLFTAVDSNGKTVLDHFICEEDSKNTSTHSITYSYNELYKWMCKNGFKINIALQKACDNKDIRHILRILQTESLDMSSVPDTYKHTAMKLVLDSGVATVMVVSMLANATSSFANVRWDTPETNPLIHSLKLNDMVTAETLLKKGCTSQICDLLMLLKEQSDPNWLALALKYGINELVSSQAHNDVMNRIFHLLLISDDAAANKYIDLILSSPHFKFDLKGFNESVFNNRLIHIIDPMKLQIIFAKMGPELRQYLHDHRNDLRKKALDQISTKQPKQHNNELLYRLLQHLTISASTPIPADYDKNDITNTNLHLAIFARDKVATQTLLALPHDVYAMNKSKQSPISIAVARGDHETLEVLMQSNSAKHATVDVGAAAFIKAYKSLRKVRVKGNGSPLHAALHENNSNFFRWLLVNGEDPSVTDFNHRNVLELAISMRKNLFIDLIIRHAADKLTDEQKCLAVMSMIAVNQITDHQLMQLLGTIQSEEKIITYLDKNNKSILTHAALYHRFTLIEHLYDQVSVHFRDEDLLCIIPIAINSRRSSHFVLKLLSHPRVPMLLKTPSMRTLMHTAANAHDMDVCKRLHDIDPTLIAENKSPTGETPLQILMRHSLSDDRLELFTTVPSPSEPSQIINTAVSNNSLNEALIAAARRKDHNEVFRILCTPNVNLDFSYQDEPNHNTALHYIANLYITASNEESITFIFKELTKNPAHLHHENTDKITPLDMAIQAAMRMYTVSSVYVSYLPFLLLAMIADKCDYKTNATQINKLLFALIQLNNVDLAYRLITNVLPDQSQVALPQPAVALQLQPHLQTITATQVPEDMHASSAHQSSAPAQAPATQRSSMSPLNDLAVALTTARNRQHNSLLHELLYLNPTKYKFYADLAKLLIDAGASISTVNIDRTTPLDALTNNPNISDKLFADILDHIRPDDCDSTTSGRVFLQLCKSGRFDLAIKIYYTLKPNLECYDALKRTALHYVVQKNDVPLDGNTSLLQLMCRDGARIHAQDINGESPLSLACEHSVKYPDYNQNIPLLLIHHNQDKNPTPRTPQEQSYITKFGSELLLLQAVRACNVNVIVWLLKYGMNPNVIIPSMSESILDIAIEQAFGHLDSAPYIDCVIQILRDSRVQLDSVSLANIGKLLASKVELIHFANVANLSDQSLNRSPATLNYLRHVANLKNDIEELLGVIDAIKQSPLFTTHPSVINHIFCVRLLQLLAMPANWSKLQNTQTNAKVNAIIGNEKNAQKVMAFFYKNSMSEANALLSTEERLVKAEIVKTGPK